MVRRSNPSEVRRRRVLRNQSRSPRLLGPTVSIWVPIRERDLAQIAALHVEVEAMQSQHPGFEPRPDPRERRQVRQRDADALLLAEAADRKSTRLNSSHANISYAVFCLKK